MQVREMNLAGLKLIFPKVWKDNRGFFVETYEQERYSAHGITNHFVQDNHSLSKRGTVRGMHFQTQPGQAKLVRVGMGRIFDVVADIRPTSPTFGKWEAVILDSESHAQLYVPVGFAHGFCVLSEEAHVMYKVDSPYNSETEAGFRWDDPDVGISWPLASDEMIVSERDRTSPYFSEYFTPRHLGEP